jgi:hypothetical protein
MKVKSPGHRQLDLLNLEPFVPFLNGSFLAIRQKMLAI